MTITKEFASKLAVAFVAVAMVFSAFATSAKAQTTEDLQQMINDLLAQVAALQAQAGMGGATAAAGVCPYTWTRDLSSGSTGADVMKLQQFLNSNPDTRVAATGVGSAGMETEYYGPATAAAVSKFQVANRAAVLSPAGLVNPTGYFGPSTRAAANAQCVAAPVVSDDTADDSSDDTAMDDSDDDDSAPVRLSGEASLKSASLDSASDDTIEEGTEDAEIAEFKVEFEDGDAEISRIDVTLDASGIGATVDPWDLLDEVSIWVDGDKVADMDAGDRDEYQNDDMTLRFSGLDIVAEEDDELEIVVAASIRGNVDSSDQGTVVVSIDSMRFFDAEGVATTEADPANPDTASFTVEESGIDDELIVKTSSNDPDSSTLQVEDNAKSDWYNVFTFDLDTDDSVNDIELTTVVVTVNTPATSTYDGLVDDVEIVIDGTTIDDVVVTGGGTAVATLTFDVDGDVVIDAGDRVEAELMLRFKSLATGDEGATVQAEVTAANADAFEAEGADDLDPTTPNQLRGAAAGEVHTLRTAGIDTTMTDDSAVVTQVDAASDYATYIIEVEVTAFEQDVYIDTDSTVSMDWDLVDGAGATTTAGTSRLPVLSSTADEVNGYFEITEGATETITIQVTYTPGAATSARLLLNSITFDDDSTGAGVTKTQTTLPATDYRTAIVTITD